MGSEIFPNIAGTSTRCVIHSCWTTSNNHSRPVHDEHRHVADGFPVRRLVGHLRIGERNRSLPGFVTMYDTLAADCPRATRRTGARDSCRAFTRDRAPAKRRADRQFVSPERVSDREQRSQLDLLKKLNQRHLARRRTTRSWPRGSKVLSWLTDAWAPNAWTSNAKSRATQALPVSTIRNAPHRQAMPDRPAAGRARRALRADL